MAILFTRLEPHDQSVSDKWIGELRDQWQRVPSASQQGPPNANCARGSCATRTCTLHEKARALAKPQPAPAARTNPLEATSHGLEGGNEISPRWRQGAEFGASGPAFRGGTHPVFHVLPDTHSAALSTTDSVRPL